MCDELTIVALEARLVGVEAELEELARGLRQSGRQVFVEDPSCPDGKRNVTEELLAILGRGFHVA